MRNICLGLLCLVMLKFAYAETCPSIADIKHHALTGWELHEADETKLTSQRINQFEKNIAQFTLAEWKQDNKQSGTVRCYYRDQEGASFEMYLAHNNVLVENSKNYWYPVTGFIHCAAGAEKCAFNQSKKKLIVTTAR